MENRNPYITEAETLEEETPKARAKLQKEIKRAIKRATRRKSDKIKIIIILVFAGLYAIFSLIITLNEKIWKDERIPEWHELFEMAGFSSSAYKGNHGDFAVHFIDVGQGDCALAVYKDYTILIDAGEISEKSKVITYLRSLDIERIDMIIASHPHSDHIGSLSAVIDRYGTDLLIIPEVTAEMTPVSSSFENMINSADKCGAELRFAEVGETLSVSEDFSIDFIAPVADYEDLNNYSIVCRLNYGENSFIFTGDIEEIAERDIVDSGADISADVVKIAHHGSSTSSLKVFLQSVDPDYAVISVGSRNDYGHPHDKTLDLLRLLEINLYRTDYHGDIVIFSDKTNLTVVTENKEVPFDVYS